MSSNLKISVQGTIGSLALVAVYFAIVSLAQSFSHAVEEFVSLSYLMVPLVAGFGVQVSLFSYSRNYAKQLHQGSASVTASGGLSSVSMIACCAHHVTDLLPFIGVTAAAVFLTTYQTLFIALGLLSNMIGITVMLAVMQKHHLYHTGGAFEGFMKLNMTSLRNLTIAASFVAAVGFGLTIAAGGGASATAQSTVISLPEKTSSVNSLNVVVTPLPFSLGQEVRFDIAMDTHSGDLSFDLTRVSSVVDSNGVTYLPLGWEGSPSGGHHREGVLTFPPIRGTPNSIKLSLDGLYGADRIFEWSIPE